MDELKPRRKRKLKPVNEGSKQGDRDEKGRFAKGHSGNPKGTKTGSKHRATILAEQLLSEDVEAITKKLVTLAKRGEMAAIKIIIDKLVPNAKSSPVKLSIPEINDVADLPQATSALVKAVTTAMITPDQAVEISKVLTAHYRAVELAELVERVTRLEARQ